MRDKNSPRVLIVGAAPVSAIDATGITLVNLFSDWPADCLAQIYDNEISPDPRICSRFWRFGSNNIAPVRIAKKFLNGFRGNKKRNIQVAVNSKDVAPSSSLATGLLGACGDIAPLRLPVALLDWVEEFKPDVIYSVLGSVRMMNVVLQLSKRFALPIVPHFMDDWPTTAYTESLVLSLPRFILGKKLNSVLSRSKFGLTICADMAEEFSRRYGKRFDYFMNCVEIPGQNEINLGRRDGLLKFGFVGGLHLNRWRSLVWIARALQELKDEGSKVSFEIYAPRRDLASYGYLFEEYSVVSKMTSISVDDVSKTLSSLDVLIHVESFLELDSRYTRLSISTKIPQYMSVGRPILAVGPETLSSMRYVKRTGAGLVVNSEGNMPELLDAVKSLIDSPSLRANLADVGKKVAYECHDAAKERIRFSETLAGVTF